jgi:hypothetical protein
VRVVPLTAPARRASDPLAGRDTPMTAKDARVVHNGAATGADVHRENPAALSTPDATTPPAPEEIQTGGALAPDEATMPGPSATGGNGTLDPPNAPATPTDPATTVASPASGASATSQPATPVGSTGTTPAPSGAADSTPVTS